jgi:hypothetical protein
MNRRSIALLALIACCATSAVALPALPKVKPKTGNYAGKSADAKNPGTLRVTKVNGVYRAALLKLLFHVDCSDANGNPSQDNVEVKVIGKFHKATVTTDKNTFVRSYKFTAKRQTTGPPGQRTSYYNLEAEFIAANRVRVTGIYSDQVADESGDAVNECSSGSESWRLKRN